MTIIKVPNKIQIGAHQFTIVLSPALIDDGSYGRTNNRTLLIEISPERPPSQKAVSLIHEILHIVNNTYNHHEIVEREIDALAEGIGQVLSQMIEFDWNGIETREVG